MQLTAPPMKPEFVAEFVADEPVSAISTPNLTSTESSELLACINEVRAGGKRFYVRLTNRKQTKGHKRMPGVDYRADPALAPHAHEGWLYAAPTNKKRMVYLRLMDEARAPLGEDGEPELDPETGEPIRKWNYTSVTMAGILSFKVIGDAPGPLAAKVAPTLDATAQQALLAQAFQMGMTIQAQAQGLAQPPQPPAQ